MRTDLAPFGGLEGGADVVELPGGDFVVAGRILPRGDELGARGGLDARALMVIARLGPTGATRWMLHFWSCSEDVRLAATPVGVYASLYGAFDASGRTPLPDERCTPGPGGTAARVAVLRFDVDGFVRTRHAVAADVVARPMQLVGDGVGVLAMGQLAAGARSVVLRLAEDGSEVWRHELAGSARVLARGPNGAVYVTGTRDVATRGTPPDSWEHQRCFVRAIAPDTGRALADTLVPTPVARCVPTALSSSTATPVVAGVLHMDGGVMRHFVAGVDPDTTLARWLRVYDLPPEGLEPATPLRAPQEYVVALDTDDGSRQRSGARYAVIAVDPRSGETRRIATLRRAGDVVDTPRVRALGAYVWILGRRDGVACVRGMPPATSDSCESGRVSEPGVGPVRPAPPGLRFTSLLFFWMPARHIDAEP